MKNKFEYKDNHRPFLIKISNTKKYLEDLQNGIVYMNTPVFFKKLGEETGDGMGDKSELENKYNGEIEVSALINGDNKIIYSGQSNVSYSLTQNTKYSKICCLYYPQESQIKVNYDDNGEYYYQFNLSDRDIQKLENDFGSHAMIMSAPNFIFNMINNKKHNLYYGEVKYVAEDNADRFTALRDNTPNLFLYKNENFSYQNEIRFIIQDYNTDPLILNIDDMHTSSLIIDLKDINEQIITLDRN